MLTDRILERNGVNGIHAMVDVYIDSPAGTAAFAHGINGAAQAVGNACRQNHFLVMNKGLSGRHSLRSILRRLESSPLG
jgi:hypothetical protein